MTSIRRGRLENVAVFVCALALATLVTSLVAACSHPNDGDNTEGDEFSMEGPH